MRRGRRNDIFDQPWVPIAAVIGVIAVIAIAVYFFMGGFGSGGESATIPGATPAQSTTNGGSSPAVVGTLNPSTIKEQPTVTVPGEGVYVKVNYLGSYSGKYGMEGSMATATDSGEKAFEVVNATGLVTATFKKTDSSTKPHELKVEIWKDGKVLKYDATTAPKGEVTITQIV